jgi:hypothetical protein
MTLIVKLTGDLKVWLQEEQCLRSAAVQAKTKSKLRLIALLISKSETSARAGWQTTADPEITTVRASDARLSA